MTIAEVTTFLIDGNALFREGMKSLLKASGFFVSGEAARTADAVRAVANGARPKLIILDIPANAGVEDANIPALRSMLPESRIVVLTHSLSAERLATVMEMGADGYLLKDLSTEALVQSLRLVLLGEKVFPTDLAEILVSRRGHVASLGEPPASTGLSARETEILTCLVTGDSNKVIANRLNITEATVKVHLKSLLRKIKVSNRTQAAIWALHHGFSTSDMRLSA